MITINCILCHEKDQIITKDVSIIFPVKAETEHIRTLVYTVLDLNGEHILLDLVVECQLDPATNGICYLKKIMFRLRIFPEGFRRHR